MIDVIKGVMFINKIMYALTRRTKGIKCSSVLHWMWLYICTVAQPTPANLL